MRRRVVAKERSKLSENKGLRWETVIAFCVEWLVNLNYRSYRRGRRDDPGGIGTVTVRFPSVGVRSSLPEARTGLKGVGITCSDEKARTGHRRGPARIIYNTGCESPVKEVLLQK